MATGNPETVAEAIARICHEANRAYCASLGDHSHTVWEFAPQWQKDSAIAGVEAIMSGEVTSPRESHESWLRHKEAEGWTFGPVKDPIAKTHPCFLPYDELPESQRRKDHLFRAVVQALTEEI